MTNEQWSRRLASEHNFQLKILKNRIADTLRADYKDFKNAQDLPMTVETGEVLRIQLEQVYAKLERLGIPLNEGKDKK